MKNQYRTLLSFAIVLCGALFFSWNAYADIQSQEEDNKNAILNEAQKLSIKFKDSLNDWQQEIRDMEYVSVLDSITRGDVAISSNQPLWPYGEFIAISELSQYVDDIETDSPRINFLTTQELFSSQELSDPYLIRLYIEQNVDTTQSIETIEQLVSAAEQAELITQKDNINFVKKIWTFKSLRDDDELIEPIEMWRSVVIPNKLFEIGKGNSQFFDWTAKDPGKNLLLKKHFQDSPYYWKLTPEGQKRIRQPGSRQGFYLSLIVSACVFIYGIIFFLRSNNQLSRQAEQREQLVADISHELRTPVTTLRLYSEMLLDGRIQKEEDQEKYLKNMVRESNRLSRLINNVLDFSRMSRGKLRLNIMSISLQLFGEDLRYIIEGLDKEKRVQILLDDDIDFMGDLDATMQVIYNLINNAIKYADGTPITVSSEVTENHLKIIVQDEGHGIDDELKPHLFEPFTRGKNVHKDQIQGSGLGLSVSRSLMTTMEGQLSLENSEKGARFVAKFKLAKS